MNVLVVADVSPVVVRGGAERVLWELAKGLAERGHRVRIVCRGGGEDLAGTLVRDQVVVRHFAVDRTSSLRFLVSSILGARAAVREECRREPPDVLHVHQPLAGLGALLATDARFVYTFLSPAPMEYRTRAGMTGHHRTGVAGAAGAVLLRCVEWVCLRRARRVHVLSRFSAGQVSDLYGVTAPRLAVIPGGVDTTLFRPAGNRLALRKDLGLPADRPVLFTLRNLEARMGIDTLLRAAVVVRPRRPDAFFVIGGSGSQTTTLRSLADELGLASSVHFTGWIPEAMLPAYYQTADAFILPTRALEGFGLVTVEALACGTPVLGTPVGATPEILGPISPNLVFDDAGADAVAQGVLRFLERPAETFVGDLRAACRRHAESRYRWDIAIEAFEALVRSA
ncbi:MAG: glycosyltransferase family 4 protein [Candidatus Rokubacteria bacterium]|nr:glycosyltransferase family 4 protein [Candidatus Rokubacteria bacterium]MBI3827525.1 glycosyltransferase family 4 protein [Candidatus Rokubacteria bacterium]